MKATMAWMCHAFPPDHVDDVPVVEPNQQDGVPVIPEPVLVDEDEDPEEKEFEEEEEPQEEEDDMEVDIEEDKNELELTYPYEEVEDTVESEDETVPASVYEVGDSSTTPFLREDSDGLLPGLIRRDINSLFWSDDFSFETTVWLRDGACIGRKEGKSKGQLLCENNSGKSNQKDNSHQPSQNNQKQANARAMTTALTNEKVSSGSLPLCKHCFTRHVGQCTIKCHKCGKIGHKARYCKEKSVATGANAQPIPDLYFLLDEQGHTRNQCPKKVKQEETREVCGRTYVIKDAKPQGLNVVSGTFLLNNRYASVLFDLGFDRSFVNTIFSSILEIDPCRIILSQVWDDYLEF
ncbi:reverse transcriptase domain-containing protein [Tanacetum coccineum]|uniref:Reverse transcriptase domain-containing protein n=1 Tax=Tanacetum coccineum TaxID=301880 RepID=A0ABQ5C725_9ASTR